MQHEFKGFHGEWNLGSPGGWEYQRMIQEIYQPAWQKFKEYSGCSVELDLADPLFRPSLGFAELLLRGSNRNFPGRDPFVVLMAEEETLDDVVENRRFVELLKNKHKAKAALIGPEELKLENGRLSVRGQEPTIIFIDFNTSVLVQLEARHSIEPVVEAIRRGLVVNPRGMEAINVKEIFEPVSRRDGKIAKSLSRTTVEHTPWTRVFYERRTTGPDGREIELVEWAVKNPDKWVLKPGSGWSGKGIFAGPKLKNEKEAAKAVKQALDPAYYGSYIIQEFVPTALWSELMPRLNDDRTGVELKERQTDFRCLVSSRGLVGFLARYGGIPTNVGSGGGVQALAIVKSGHSPGEAAALVNQAFLDMDVEKAKQVRQIIDDGALGMKFIYLNGPIPIGLRPRLISDQQVEALRVYAENLYQDTLKLEKLWLEGKLDGYAKLSAREREIISLQPRTADTAAMMASDGLFDFGAGTGGR